MICTFGQRYLVTTVSAVALLGLAPLHASAQGNPLRDAYFGETHVHTSYSLDAWLFGNRMTDPGDAYKYFALTRLARPGSGEKAGR
jgi:hypothetical protein